MRAFYEAKKHESMKRHKRAYRGVKFPGNGKGSRKNNFLEFAPAFVSDWGDLREDNRSRSKDYVEDCTSKDWPKTA